MIKPRRVHISRSNDFPALYPVPQTATRALIPRGHLWERILRSGETTCHDHEPGFLIIRQTRFHLHMPAPGRVRNRIQGSSLPSRPPYAPGRTICKKHRTQPNVHHLPKNAKRSDGHRRHTVPQTPPLFLSDCRDLSKFLTNTICQMDRCFAIGPSVSLHDACICRAKGLASKEPGGVGMDVLLYKYVPARDAGMFGVGVGSCGLRK